MHSFLPSFRTYSQFASRVLLACCLAALLGAPLHAQSTYGVILGTVRDAGGSLVTNAEITLTNTGTTALRSATTDGSGNYAFRNIDVGTYKVTIAAPGFQTESMPA